MHDDEDRSAILARREGLRRRELLLGALTAPIAAAGGCIPCLEPVPRSLCEPNGELTFESAHWLRQRYTGELMTTTGPLFEGDQDAGSVRPSPTAQLSTTAPSTALTPAGLAALDDLAGIMSRASPGSVTVTIVGTPCQPGAPCVDAAARAEAIRAHLASRGAIVRVSGSGTAGSERFQMTLQVLACTPAAR